LETSAKAIAPESFSVFVESSAAAWDAIPDVLIVFDAQRRIVFLNTEAKRYLGGRGLPQDGALLGKAVKVCDPDTQTELRPARLPSARALQGETIDRSEYLVRPAPHGTCFWVECGAQPLYGKEGNIRGAALVLRDITARKKRQFEMESTSQLRDFIFQGNVAGIVHSTVDGRILDCNDALVRML